MSAAGTPPVWKTGASASSIGPRWPTRACSRSVVVINCSLSSSVAMSASASDEVGKRSGPEAWTSYAQPGQPLPMGGGKHGEVGLRSVGPGSGDVARGHLADPPGVPLLEEVWVRTCE